MRPFVVIVLVGLSLVASGCVGSGKTDFGLIVQNMTDQKVDVKVSIINETGAMRQDWSVALSPNGHQELEDHVVLSEGKLYFLTAQTSTGFERNDTHRFSGSYDYCRIEIRPDGIGFLCIPRED